MTIGHEAPSERGETEPPANATLVEPLGYTVAQACKAIPCSRSHLHRAIKSGHLRAVKDGRKVLISRKAILDYLDRGDGEAEAEVDT